MQERGSAITGMLSGDRRSGRIDADAALILDQVEHTPDITLGEIQSVLTETDAAAGIARLWRLLRPHEVTLE